ncbi:MAG TPA: hypothetical protein PKA39_10335, partial [Ignavibacteria bacterium]|nr:hypothetical protein [Ignavibacteria bacterium]
MAEKTVSEKKTKGTNGVSKDLPKYEFMKETEKNFGLTNEEMIHAYKAMLLSRFTDDRIDTLIKQGKATFLISGSGHEAIQVACAMAMEGGK